MTLKLGRSKEPFFLAMGLGWGGKGAAASTLGKHDWPSVSASALRLSWFHLLTSWDCPLSLCWPLCKAGETGPFLPSQQSLQVRGWALVVGTGGH